MKYIIKKLITLIITLFAVSLLAFLAFQVISDPATAKLGTQATPEKLAALREEMGLNRPVAVRYFEWLGNFVTGDFGMSYNYSMPVKSMILSKIPLTAGIVLFSFVIMLAVSFPLGILSARHEGGILDQFLTVSGQIFMSIPAFLMGVALTYFFGIVLKFFTPGTYVPFAENPGKWFMCLLFPSLAIAIPRIAMTVRMLRASVIQQFSQQYVRTAYSRGAGRGGILRHHVLRNAIIPVISFIASCMAEIVANCILVEQVFALQGTGVLLLSSIGNRDFPVVLAIIMIIAFWVVIINFLADVLYQLVDPRIRLG